MKRIIAFILIALSFNCFSQVNQSELVLLAETFHEYHAWNTPDSSVFKKLETIKSENLQTEKRFISELIKDENNLLSKRYLSKPDTLSLQNLYIVTELSQNMYSEKPLKHSQVINQVNQDSISYIRLLANYYELLFKYMVNKFEELSMSGIDFNLKELGLNTQTEKEVFFFASFNSVVFWNYVWIPSETADEEYYKEAIMGFSRLPTYNGMQYYLFQNLEVTEFREEYSNVDELKYGYNRLTTLLESHCLFLNYQLKYLETKTLYNTK